MYWSFHPRPWAKTKGKGDISCGVQVSTSVAKQLKTSITIVYYLNATVALEGCYSKNFVTKMKKTNALIHVCLWKKGRYKPFSLLEETLRIH